MSGISFENKYVRFILSVIQHYNHNKYWRRREKVVNPYYDNRFLKYYYLLWIKWIDAHHNASFGSNYNSGAMFKSPPHLPMAPME